MIVFRIIMDILGGLFSFALLFCVCFGWVAYFYMKLMVSGPTPFWICQGIFAWYVIAYFWPRLCPNCHSSVVHRVESRIQTNFIRVVGTKSYTDIDHRGVIYFVTEKITEGFNSFRETRVCRICGKTWEFNYAPAIPLPWSLGSPPEWTRDLENRITRALVLLLWIAVHVVPFGFWYWHAYAGGDTLWGML